MSQSFLNYISRLEEFDRVIGEVNVRVLDDRDNGTVPPDFVIEKALMGMRSFSGSGAEANPLIATLPAKLEKP